MAGWQTTESIIYTVIVSKSKNFGLYFRPSLAVKVHMFIFPQKLWIIVIWQTVNSYTIQAYSCPIGRGIKKSGR